MKKEYMTPHLTMEAFVPNEYVAVCWGYDTSSGTAVACDQIAHPEYVTFYSSSWGLRVRCDNPLYKYDAQVLWIDKNNPNDPSDDVAHWVTIEGWNASPDGLNATTDHYAKIPVKRGVNQS